MYAFWNISKSPELEPVIVNVCLRPLHYDHPYANVKSINLTKRKRFCTKKEQRNSVVNVDLLTCTESTAPRQGDNLDNLVFNFPTSSLTMEGNVGANVTVLDDEVCSHGGSINLPDVISVPETNSPVITDIATHQLEVGSTGNKPEENELTSLADGVTQRAESSAKDQELSDYICAICQSHFNDSEDLQIHLKWHDFSEDMSDNVTDIEKMNNGNESSERACTSSSSIEPILPFNVDSTRLSVSCSDGKSLPLCSDDISNDLSKALDVDTGQMYNHITNSIAKFLNSNESNDVSSTTPTLTNSGNAKKLLQSRASQSRTCEVCKKVFSNRKRYRDHVIRMHCDYGSRVRAIPIQNSKQQICEFCGKVFPNRCTYQQHVKTIHPSNYEDTVKSVASTSEPMICDVCNRIFSKWYMYVDHVRRMHPNIKPYKCDECDESFFYSTECFVHMKAQHTLYKCSLCDVTFSDMALFQKHEEEHKSGKYKDLFWCQFCKRSFGTSHTLARHKLQCSSQTLQVHVCCEICEKKFASPSELRRHLRRSSHGEPKFKCSICSKVLMYETSLKEHMLRHTASHSLVCDKCDYSCIFEYEMNNHKTRHSDERPYSCPDCSKTFKQTSSLNKHRVLHTGEQYRKCALCPAEFNLNKNFNRHMKIKHPESLSEHKSRHTASRSLVCDKCDYTCMFQYEMNDHKTRHSDERPYSCPHCSKTFKQTKHLNKHMVLHSGEQYRKCVLCPAEFNFKSNFKSHMKIKHPDMPEQEDSEAQNALLEASSYQEH